jgi:aryl-alcohol dehydrogenase-like predicted oxidoreductase
LLDHLGVGSIPWSPLARGRLARPWGNSTVRSENDAFARNLYRDADESIVGAVQAVAEEHGVPMAQVGLAWVLGNPVVAAPLVGATKVGHLDDAVAALDVELSVSDVARLEAAYTPRGPTGF